jgi:hypothetical protein
MPFTPVIYFFALSVDTQNTVLCWHEGNPVIWQKLETPALVSAAHLTDGRIGLSSVCSSSSIFPVAIGPKLLLEHRTPPGIL